MGEVYLTYKGMAEVMFEKAMLDSYTVDRLEEIGYFTAPTSKRAGNCTGRSIVR